MEEKKKPDDAVSLHAELTDLTRRLVAKLGVKRARRMLSSFVSLYKPEKETE